MLKRALFLFALPVMAFGQGSLENPAKGATDSGIGIVSGWHCTASEIEIRIDGQSFGLAGSGTGRPDTESVCGRTDTGFSLLFNYGELEEGEHTVAMYADGELFTQHNFNSVRAGGANFVRGLSKSVKVAGFPNSAGEAELNWSTAKQSFSVTKINKSAYSRDSVIDSFNNPKQRPHWPLARDAFSGRSSGFIGDKTATSTDSTTFTFQITEDTFRLDREAFLSGTCRYEGSYTINGNSIDTSGSYQCDNFTNGTYTASGLRVSEDGVYTGKFLMTEDGQSDVVVDIHSGL